MQVLTESERIALKQTLDYLKEEEGKSHMGYFYFGWAGTQLRKLLTRTAGTDKYGEAHFITQ